MVCNRRLAYRPYSKVRRKAWNESSWVYVRRRACNGVVYRLLGIILPYKLIVTAMGYLRLSVTQ